jgi:exo-1,4-beta-D-glucosaminidase
VLKLDMSEAFSQEASLDLAADGTKNVLTLPALEGLSPTYFLRMTLHDAAGKLVGSNFYWLSTKPEKLAYDKSQWHVTPTTQLADFTALAQLPKVRLDVKAKHQRKGAEGLTTVTLTNTSKSLAFFVRLKVDKGAGGDEILPVVWQDNYVSLLPGEKRELTARYKASALGAAKPVVEVSGLNVLP